MHLYRCKNIDILVITSTAAEQQQRVSIRYIERETRKGICRSKRKKHKRCRKINEPWAGHAILHVFFGVFKREFIPQTAELWGSYHGVPNPDPGP